ncbi:hypothetical protein MBLNU459_g0394t1 [Dothideomycetes sp. NU459]
MGSGSSQSSLQEITPVVVQELDEGYPHIGLDTQSHARVGRQPPQTEPAAPSISPLTPPSSNQPRKVQFDGLDPSVVVDIDGPRRTRRASHAPVRQMEQDQVVEMIRKSQQTRKRKATTQSSATSSSSKKKSQPLQLRSVNIASRNKPKSVEEAPPSSLPSTQQAPQASQSQSRPPVAFKLYWIAEFDGKIAYQPYMQLKSLDMRVYGEGQLLITTATEAVKEFARNQGFNHHLIKKEAVVSCLGVRGKASDEKIAFRACRDWQEIFRLIAYNDSTKKTEHSPKSLYQLQSLRQSPHQLQSLCQSPLQSLLQSPHQL